MKEKRVVITGMGVVSPIGNSIDDFRNSLQEGRGGIAPLTDMDQYGSLAVHVAGMVKDFNPVSMGMDVGSGRRSD